MRAIAASPKQNESNVEPAPQNPLSLDRYLARWKQFFTHRDILEVLAANYKDVNSIDISRFIPSRKEPAVNHGNHCHNPGAKTISSTKHFKKQDCANENCHHS